MREQRAVNDEQGLSKVAAKKWDKMRSERAGTLKALGSLRSLSPQTDGTKRDLAKTNSTSRKTRSGTFNRFGSRNRHQNQQEILPKKSAGPQQKTEIATVKFQPVDQEASATEHKTLPFQLEKDQSTSLQQDITATSFESNGDEQIAASLTHSSAPSPTATVVLPKLLDYAYERRRDSIDAQTPNATFKYT